MRTSFLSILGLCALAIASPDLLKRTDPDTNSTSYLSSTVTSFSSAPYNTGGGDYSTSSGHYNNATATPTGASSTQTSAHHSATSSLSPTSSSAGAAATGLWANNQVKGAMAGAVGVLGLALVL